MFWYYLIFLASVINFYTIDPNILTFLSVAGLIILILARRAEAYLAELPKREWTKRNYNQMKEEGYSEEEIIEHLGKGIGKFDNAKPPWWMKSFVSVVFNFCLLLLLIGVVLRVVDWM